MDRRDQQAGQTGAISGTLDVAGEQTVAPVLAAPAPVPTVRVVSAAASTAAAVARPAALRVADAHTVQLPLIAAPPLPPRVAPPVAPAERRATPQGNRVADFVEHLDLIQVICWQVAVVGVVLCVRQPWPVLTGVSVGAALLIASTTVRLRGRWLYELAALGCRYLLRSRRRDLPENGKAKALLALLLPGSTVGTVETGQGPVMVISHTGGLTAMVRPRVSESAPIGALPSPAALLPSAEGLPHEFGVQTVFHGSVRADRPTRVWLAVHAVRTVETAADDELTLALRNGLRRVLRALKRAGVPTDPLPEEAALATIAALGHVTGGRTEVREDWGFWRTGAVSQTCFQLHGWQRLSDRDARRLVADLLARAASVSATVTLGARSGPGEPTVTAALRLAATTEAALDGAVATMTDLAAARGVRLVRLDGTHLTGVAASLPIGGFPG
ncbi:type VII secretion protein EccE [Actinokineospora sp.]|uniref:type VII secretion protein EccE n=1 Tax=Actinokineospora sp. TaxID=1872133 RepID=UPI004038139B